MNLISTENLAMIGAITGIIGSLAGVGRLVWDFYTWKISQARLKISISTVMSLHPPNPKFSNGMLMRVTVTNVGKSKTTLLALAFFNYKFKLLKLRKIRSSSGIIVIEYYPEPLPKVLEPGEQWTTIVVQNTQIEDLALKGNLFCIIEHSMSNKPTKSSVTLNKIDKKKSLVNEKLPQNI